jgi:hypothetical protein
MGKTEVESQRSVIRMPRVPHKAAGRTLQAAG